MNCEEYKVGYRSLFDIFETLDMYPVEMLNERLNVHVNCVNCGAPLKECKCEYCGSNNSSTKTYRR